jgi:cobalt-zinc-cadmium efflux system protein
VKTGLQWIDPIMSLIIILVIFWGTWKLFTESIRLALDGIPSNIKLEDVKSSILQTKGVVELHDLHLWAMSTNENALSAHVITSLQKTYTLLSNLQKILTEEFNISHVTIQVEHATDNLNCKKC